VAKAGDTGDRGCGSSRQGGRALKAGRFRAALMLRVPLWAGPSHVMELRPIGIAGDLDPPVPSPHDPIQALAKRRR
jgi:hypothetical protein